MASFAYVLLPVTGLVAYLTGTDARTRFHGLQAIAIGLGWPLLLYAAALGPALVVQIVFAVGLLVWLGFLIGTVARRDPRLPGLGGLLERVAATGIRDVPRSTSGSSSQSSR